MARIFRFDICGIFCCIVSGQCLVIVYLNWWVYEVAKTQIDIVAVQIGSIAGSNDQQ